MEQEAIFQMKLSEMTLDQFLKAIEAKNKKNQIEELEKSFEQAFEKLPAEAKEIPQNKEIRVGVIDIDGVLYDGSLKTRKELLQVVDDIINVYYLKNRFAVYETVNKLYIVALLSAILTPSAMIGCVEKIEYLKETKELSAWVMDKDGYYNMYDIVLDKMDNFTKVSDELYFVQEGNVLMAVQTGVEIKKTEEFDEEKFEKFCEEIQEEEEIFDEVEESDEYNVSYV